jgi:hypothetical protein
VFLQYVATALAPFSFTVLVAVGYSVRDIYYEFMGDNSTTYEPDMLLPEFIILKDCVEQHLDLVVYSTGWCLQPIALVLNYCYVAYETAAVWTLPYPDATAPNAA